ncbi:hypothetical protein [Oryzihumus leptocrescens]|uniref:hypothetical protein n=1 Tax=Oryzihumus leptocrescens TaxID=297536 RepID=UPI00163A0229|nr:hypothetical protein [Oryzihumus leptocrescens]
MFGVAATPRPPDQTEASAHGRPKPYTHPGRTRRPFEPTHREAGGELLIDEEFDNVKVIGVYSDEQSVAAAIGRARSREGFRDEPDCFMPDPYTLDQDNWTDGFVSLPADDD